MKRRPSYDAVGERSVFFGLGDLLRPGSDLGRNRFRPRSELFGPRSESGSFCIVANAYLKNETSWRSAGRVDSDLRSEAGRNRIPGGSIISPQVGIDFSPGRNNFSPGRRQVGIGFRECQNSRPRSESIPTQVGGRSESDSEMVENSDPGRRQVGMCVTMLRPEVGTIPTSGRCDLQVGGRSEPSPPPPDQSPACMNPA